MKVPEYGQPRVENRPRTPPTPRALPSGGFDAIARGLSSVGDAADAAVGAIERDQHEADVVATRNALTEAERRALERLETGKGVQTNSGSVLPESGDQGATPKPGFLSLEGMPAAEARAGVLKGLDDDLRDISGRLASDRQRQMFDREAQRLQLGWQKTIEAHTANQVQRAKVDAVKAAESSAIRQAVLDANVDDDNFAMDLVAGVTGPARALATSPQVADEAALAVRANVTKARLDQMLANSNVASAERVLTANRVALGADADRYDKAINTVKLGMQAQAAAADVVKKGLAYDGQVDQTVVLDELGKLPEDLRAKVEPIAYKLMAEREQAYDKETQRISRDAYSLFNAKGWGEFAKTGLETELAARNPELWKRLREDAKEQLKAVKRARSGSAADRRAQVEMNKIARNEFLALPIEQQASADISEFLVGRGTGPVDSKENPVPSELAKLQKAAREHVSKGLGVSRESFVNDISASLQKYAPKPGTSKESRAKAALWWADRKADAVNAYTIWTDNHPGKKPEAADIAKMSAEVMGDLPPNAEHPETIAESARRAVLLGGGGGAPESPKLLQIPAEERTKIEAALRKKGRVITEQAIEALYRQVNGGR